jgi:SDR family mycofactocin-dependent oxidoreductase
MGDSRSRRFEGKVAFVTGAARGQGRAEALQLAEEGADIIAIDVCKDMDETTYRGATPADLEETVKLVEATDRRIVARQADVRDFEAVQSALFAGVAELGRLDVVVANAGLTTAALSWEITAEQWRETIDVNLTGVFHTTKAAIPILLEQGTGGSIVITSSTAGLTGLPFLAHYVAAKHGVVGLCRTMANELAQYDIRVNTVHPYAVNTALEVNELRPLLDQFPDTLKPMYQASLPYPASEPEDIARAVVWLASDEARHVTGVQLPVDLGRTTR